MKWIAGSVVCVGLMATPLLAQRGGGGGASHGGGGGVGQGAGAGVSQGRSGDFGQPDMNGGRQTGMGHGNQPSSMSQGRTASELLTQNTKLSSKLGSLLPAGTDVQQAASGFKNLGAFVSAVHVSHNLGIPFEDLKSKMTGPGAVSLGKAIQELKPEANSKDEAKKAKHQADQDMKES
jgi:hypothetical protein